MRQKNPLFEVYGKCAFQGKNYTLIRQENKGTFREVAADISNFDKD